MTATPPLPLRFRGNRSNPNYPAVAHLLRIYAAHLGAGLIEIDDTGPVEVLWDAGMPVPGSGPCLVFPGRREARPETSCARTRSGYPVPAGEASGSVADAARGSTTAGKATAIVPGAGKILEAADGRTLAWDGPGGYVLVSGWDLLSFCADILFRRADHLPARKRQARDAIGVGQWDQAFGLLEEPWVDRWMFRLLGLLPRFRDPVNALPSQARIWLTHDLDNLAKWRPRSVAGQILRTPVQLVRGRFRPLARAWSEIAVRALTGRDPYDVMGRVLAMETEKARRSANFFLANGRDHLFHRYDLAKPRFRRVMRECIGKGMDVGLHGQVHHIADPAAIAGEARKLAALAGRPVALNRQHYLRWDPSATFAGLEAAGIRVDSTLGYNDSPGFRAGTAFPYPWFDCAAGRATRLLEVPLILAEFQFYDPQAFDGEAVRRTLRHYLEAATRQGGVFTVLFHNQYFHEGDFPGHGEVYAAFWPWRSRSGAGGFRSHGDARALRVRDRRMTATGPGSGTGKGFWIRIALIVLMWAAAVAWYGRAQKPVSHNNGLGWDGSRYHHMYQQAQRGERFAEHKPFVYRVATPWLAARLGFWDARTAFHAINLTGVLLTGCLLFAIMTVLGARPGISLFLVATYFAQWHAPLRQQFYDSFNVDAPAQPFICLIFLLYLAMRPSPARIVWMSLAAFIGVFFRESVIFASLAVFLAEAVAAWRSGAAFGPALLRDRAVLIHCRSAAGRHPGHRAHPSPGRRKRPLRLHHHHPVFPLP